MLHVEPSVSTGMSFPLISTLFYPAGETELVPGAPGLRKAPRLRSGCSVPSEGAGATGKPRPAGKPGWGSRWRPPREHSALGVELPLSNVGCAGVRNKFCSREVQNPGIPEPAQRPEPTNPKAELVLRSQAEPGAPAALPGAEAELRDPHTLL